MESPYDDTPYTTDSSYTLALEYQAQGWYNIYEFLLYDQAHAVDMSLEMELTDWNGQQFRFTTLDPFRYFLRLQQSLMQGEMVHARVGAIDRALGQLLAERTRPAQKYLN
jgi:hypothetical protein